MSSEDQIADSIVLRNLWILTGALFGFFLVILFLARAIVY